MLLSAVAVVATGIAVSSGIVVTSQAPVDTAAAALTTARPAPPVGVAAQGDKVIADERSDGTDETSRSARRTSLTRLKKQALDQRSGGQVTKTADLSHQDPRAVARALLPQFGFSASQFGCLDALYNSESGWDIHADNPTSSAYGIPQALPGSKMASAGPDWQHNPATQIRWGLQYIRSSYGTPCSAWSFKQSHNWY